MSTPSTDTELDRQLDGLIDGICTGFARTLQNMGVIGKLNDMDRVTPLKPDEAKAQIKQLMKYQTYIYKQDHKNIDVWGIRVAHQGRQVVGDIAVNEEEAKAKLATHLATLQAQADKGEQDE